VAGKHYRNRWEPNIAIRRNFVPNEFNNDAYSEVPGTVTDSISLVPPTLSDGTFYVTVYGTNTYNCTLQSGPPAVTDINFTSVSLNDDPNRAAAVLPDNRLESTTGRPGMGIVSAKLCPAPDRFAPECSAKPVEQPQQRNK